MKFRITDTMRLSLQKPSTLASKFWPFMNFIILKLLIVMLQMFVPQQLNDTATFFCVKQLITGKYYGHFTFIFV